MPPECSQPCTVCSRKGHGGPTVHCTLKAYNYSMSTNHHGTICNNNAGLMQYAPNLQGGSIGQPEVKHLNGRVICIELH